MIYNVVYLPFTVDVQFLCTVLIARVQVFWGTLKYYNFMENENNENKA